MYEAKEGDAERVWKDAEKVGIILPYHGKEDEGLCDRRDDEGAEEVSDHPLEARPACKLVPPPPPTGEEDDAEDDTTAKDCVLGHDDGEEAGKVASGADYGGLVAGGKVRLAAGDGNKGVAGQEEEARLCKGPGRGKRGGRGGEGGGVEQEVAVHGGPVEDKVEEVEHVVILDIRINNPRVATLAPRQPDVRIRPEHSVERTCGTPAVDTHTRLAPNIPALLLHPSATMITTNNYNNSRPGPRDGNHNGNDNSRHVVDQLSPTWFKQLVTCGCGCGCNHINYTI